VHRSNPSYASSDSFKERFVELTGVGELTGVS
jgi:hypothetical protein